MTQKEKLQYDQTPEENAHRERLLKVAGGVAIGEVALPSSLESYINRIPDISAEIALMREEGGVHIPGFMPEGIAKMIGREFIGYDKDGNALSPSESFIDQSVYTVNGDSFYASQMPERMLGTRRELAEEVQVGYEFVRESVFKQLKQGFNGKYDEYSLGSGLMYGGHDLLGYFDRGIKWHRDEEWFVGGAASLAIWGEADFAWIDYNGNVQRVRQKPGDLVLFANNDPDQPDMSDTRPHMVSPPYNDDKIRLTDIIRFIDDSKGIDRSEWLGQEVETFKSHGIPLTDLNEEIQAYVKSAKG